MNRQEIQEDLEEIAEEVDMNKVNDSNRNKKNNDQSDNQIGEFIEESIVESTPRQKQKNNQQKQINSENNKILNKEPSQTSEQIYEESIAHTERSTNREQSQHTKQNYNNNNNNNANNFNETPQNKDKQHNQKTSTQPNQATTTTKQSIQTKQKQTKNSQLQQNFSSGKQITEIENEEIFVQQTELSEDVKFAISLIETNDDWKQGLELMQHILDKTLIWHPIQKLNDLAILIMNQNYFDISGEILKFCDLFLSIRGDQLFNKIKIMTFNNIGCLEKRQQNYSKAHQYFQKAIEIAQNDVQCAEQLGISFLNLGALMSLMDEHAGALEYGKRAAVVIHQIYSEYGQKGEDFELLKKNEEFIKIAKNLSISFYNVASEEFYFGRYDLAGSNYQSCYKVLLDNIGDQHELTKKFEKIIKEKIESCKEKESQLQEFQSREQLGNSEYINNENYQIHRDFKKMVVSLKDRVNPFQLSYQVKSTDFVQKGNRVFLKNKNIPINHNLKMQAVQTPHPFLRLKNFAKDQNQSSSLQNSQFLANNQTRAYSSSKYPDSNIYKFKNDKLYSSGNYEIDQTSYNNSSNPFQTSSNSLNFSNSNSQKFKNSSNKKIKIIKQNQISNGGVTRDSQAKSNHSNNNNQTNHLDQIQDTDSQYLNSGQKSYTLQNQHNFKPNQQFQRPYSAQVPQNNKNNKNNNNKKNLVDSQSFQNSRVNIQPYSPQNNDARPSSAKINQNNSNSQSKRPLSANNRLDNKSNSNNNNIPSQSSNNQSQKAQIYYNNQIIKQKNQLYPKNLVQNSEFSSSETYQSQQKIDNIQQQINNINQQQSKFQPQQNQQQQQYVGQYAYNNNNNNNNNLYSPQIQYEQKIFSSNQNKKNDQFLNRIGLQNSLIGIQSSENLQWNEKVSAARTILQSKTETKQKYKGYIKQLKNDISQPLWVKIKSNLQKKK